MYIKELILAPKQVRENRMEYGNQMITFNESEELQDNI
jgi:hypothetical protein